MELILMVFQKNPHLGQMGHFGLKMAHRHKFGSSLRMFLNFCIMKGAERYMKFSLIIFPKKKIILGKWTILGPNKRGEKVHEI